jgi:hypothetical protein
MKRLPVIIVLALAVSCLAFGQAQTAQPPKPGPEVQQMAPWLGTWQCGYENKTGSLAKSEGSITCEWFTGGFFMVCKG